jgi:hypothetical protein
MANELNTAQPTSGLSITAQLFQTGVTVGSPITCTEVGTTRFYSGNMPAITAGTYQVVFYDTGVTPLSSGIIAWDGTSEILFNDLSTATTAGIADAVWDEVLTGATHNIASSAGRRLRILDEERIIAEGQTVSATTNTITLEPIGTLCVGQTIVVTDQSTGEKQVRFILAFDGATDTATVDTNWCVVPTAGDEYLLTTVRDPLVTRVDHPTGTVGAEIDEMYLLQGLKDGETLTVTPTSRTAGAVSQTIGGDGTTTTTVSRD